MWSQRWATRHLLYRARFHHTFSATMTTVIARQRDGWNASLAERPAATKPGASAGARHYSAQALGTPADDTDGGSNGGILSGAVHAECRHRRAGYTVAADEPRVHAQTPGGNLGATALCRRRSACHVVAQPTEPLGGASCCPAPPLPWRSPCPALCELHAWPTVHETPDGLAAMAVVQRMLRGASRRP